MAAKNTARRLTIAAQTESPRPGADQSVHEFGTLVEGFLDIVIRIARSQNPAELNLLNAFRSEHTGFIQAHHEKFFLELIRSIQKRFEFGKKQPGANVHIVTFGMDVPKLPLCFISQACRLVLLDALPEKECIPDGETDEALRPLSDEALTEYITTFRLYDRPWIFFSAIYIAGIRELPTRYNRKSSGPQ